MQAYEIIMVIVIVEICMAFIYLSFVVKKRGKARQKLDTQLYNTSKVVNKIFLPSSSDNLEEMVAFWKSNFSKIEFSIDCRKCNK